MHRLFVALRPPGPVRAKLTAIMGGVADARWQDDDQLHITLRFIGEVDGRQADDVAAALGTVSGPPLDLRIDGLGMFDKRGRVDALWAGVTPYDAIAALHRKVDRACVMAGLAPEGRAYLPHITLARFARSAMPDLSGFMALHAGLSSASFTLDAFALFESHLGSDGARYDCVARYPLRG